MILDTSKVSLPDGSLKLAIEVYPGARIATDKKRRGALVDDRVIENRNETVKLIFSNGTALEGSRDQKVYVWTDKTLHCKTMEEVELGERAVGWVSGLRTVLHVAAIRYTEAPHRLVGLTTSQPYVVEGVMVR
jgi:hypothetical protein